jgi:hypothetical protein
MIDPLTFASTSPRHALPFLFAGQAQKEFFVNEAFARVDALLHPAVAGERADAPSDPAAGECWLVGDGATGAWAGHDGAVACWQASEWLFIAPAPGMRVYDAASRQFIVFADTWRRAPTPAEPTGGAVVDQQARDVIATLLAALKSAGVFGA